MEKSDKSSMFSLAKESLGEDKESLNKVEKQEDPSSSLATPAKPGGLKTAQPGGPTTAQPGGPTTAQPGGLTPGGSQCASVQAAPLADLGSSQVASMQLGQVKNTTWFFLFYLKML